MAIALDITIRDIPNSEAIEAKIRQKAEKLALFHDDIEFCKVVVDVPQKHKHQGKEYTTRIDVGVPGRRLAVNHNRDEDLYVSIRDAFAAMQRQLEAHNKRQRGEIKSHQEILYGVVDRLFYDYGFIKTASGEEYYFNASNLLNANFDELQIDTPVEFLESVGGDGLQAIHVSTVSEPISEDRG